jgi:DivIVA domain-containing protein
VGVIVAVIVGVVLLLVAALALAARDGGLSEVPVDHTDLGLPNRVLTADDIPGLRFRTGLRGYRMEDVDAALAHIAVSLRVAQPVPDPVDSADRLDNPGDER